MYLFLILAHPFPVCIGYWIALLSSASLGLVYVEHLESVLLFNCIVHYSESNVERKEW